VTTTTCDVLIIGGGMAGASCGYFLAGQARVVLLEREEQPGYHTTGRSAALFYESYGNAVIRRITRATRGFLETPPDGFAAGPILSPRGMLTVATAELVERLDAMSGQDGGPRTEPVEGDALFALAPFLRRDRIVKGVYEPDAMDIDVNALLQGFLRGLRASGGRTVTDAEVRSLQRVGAVWRRPGPAASRRRSSSTPPAPGATSSPGWPGCRRSGWCRSAGPPSPSTRRPAPRWRAGRASTCATRAGT
jgi:D-arginine dehydrogenase